MATEMMRRESERKVNGLLVGAALAILLAWGSGARAECVTVDAWRAAVIKSSPVFDVGQAEAVTPALLAAITRAYNETPPASAIAPDAVYLLMSRIKSNGMPFGDVMFGMFKGGCLMATFVAPLPHAKTGEPV